MNAVNALFVISCIFVPLLLISLNYSAIEDFYAYSVPLQNIDFEDIEENCNEQCMLEFQSQGYNCNKITNSQYFCFPPINYNKLQKRSDYWDQLIPISYGYLDLLYDDKEISLGLIKKINIIDEKNVEVTFSTGENSKFMRAEISDFNYTENKVLRIGDTFIPKCHNQNIHVYKLHDIVIQDDASFAIFIYRIGTSGIDQCEFPQILENNFGIGFD